ncbi:uncharacterized protein LOC116182925 [Photinus pyralis]|nr:uncharacterized protein LOC116163534 [Photinus pyralis]XP_031333376.1 uncharacterized protein LOC116163534 [Photinus pyralis]XP_031359348.1 uncharacterized protein LOC116182925 [Photinus pyralis]
MTQPKHVLKFSAIANLFCDADERKLIKRGENAIESNHVESFQFIAELLVMKAKVHASMRNRLYNVEINLDKDGDIVDVHCDCPRGQYLCHHMAAVCIYGHHNISITDVGCSWSAKKKLEKAQIKTIENFYKEGNHHSTTRELTDDEIAMFRAQLQKTGTAVGFSWLLSPEPVSEGSLLVNIEDFLFSAEYLSATNKVEFFANKLQVSSETIKTVSGNTIGQSQNENWLTYRTNRLTASNFGAVLAAVRRQSYPPSLFKRLTGFYNIGGVTAVQWGIAHESEALATFSNITKKSVTPTGLWLHSCGFLGASPDGLVDDNAIVEVKCPYKFREKDIRKELEGDKSYIITLNESDIFVNSDHEYYDQIQGTLELTGRSVCFLVVWTPKDTIIVQINKDLNWSKNVDLLKQFYMDHYIPQILESIFVE